MIRFDVKDYGGNVNGLLSVVTTMDHGVIIDESIEHSAEVFLVGQSFGSAATLLREAADAAEGLGVPFTRIEQLVDRAEADGGFITSNRNVKVDDTVLGLVDSLRFREVMMSRQREREADKSDDYKVARAQGYRAAVNDMRLGLDGLRP